MNKSILIYSKLIKYYHTMLPAYDKNSEIFFSYIDMYY